MTETCICKYECDLNKVNEKCLFCGKKITGDEFNNEDYFVLFRGTGKKTIYGFVCFDCYEFRESFNIEHGKGD